MQAITIAKLIFADIFIIHNIEHLDSATDIELVITRKMENIKEDILKKHGIIVKTYITKGRTDSEIVDFAKTRKMQLIVMGTHGASGYKEVVVGSNADRIVSLSEVPVLTMRALQKFGLVFHSTFL